MGHPSTQVLESTGDTQVRVKIKGLVKDLPKPCLQTRVYFKAWNVPTVAHNRHQKTIFFLNKFLSGPDQILTGPDHI